MELNLGLCEEKPADNHLSRDTAISISSMDKAVNGFERSI
jgi:hypothetical protein